MEDTINQGSRELKKMNRRRFLNICLGSLGAILAGGVIYPVLRYLVPPSMKGKRVEVRVPEKEVPLGGSKLLRIGDKPSVLIHTADGFAAFSLVCSHLGCLVKWEAPKNEFLCPCHGAKFDSKGVVILGPPPTGLESFHVEVIEGEVIVS